MDYLNQTNERSIGNSTNKKVCILLTFFCLTLFTFISWKVAVEIFDKVKSM